MVVETNIVLLLLLALSFVVVSVVQAAASSSAPSIVITDGNTKSNNIIMMEDNKQQHYRRISYNNNAAVNSGDNNDDFGAGEITRRTYNPQDDKFYALPRRRPQSHNRDAIIAKTAEYNIGEERHHSSSSNMEVERNKQSAIKEDNDTNTTNNLEGPDNLNYDYYQNNNNVLGNYSSSSSSSFEKKNYHHHHPVPPQFHTVSIEYQTVYHENTTILKNEYGIEYLAGDFYPMAIAYDNYNNALYIAHEAGNLFTNDGIFVYDLNGVKQKEIILPSPFGSSSSSGDYLAGITVGGGGKNDDGDDDVLLFAYFQIHDDDSHHTSYYEIVPINVVTGEMEESMFYYAAEASSLSKVHNNNNNDNRVVIMALDNHYEEEGMLSLEFVGDDYPYTVNIYHIEPGEENNTPERRRGLGDNKGNNNQGPKNHHDGYNMKKTLHHSGNQKWYEVVIISNCHHSRNVGINRIGIFVFMVLISGVVILLRF